jgi:alkanesulfonate monooxygenase SsuD/methylene tetrahydromethanopterin reductase-like flavin-dependent oxidoreductase (luciferase family)
MLARMRVGLVVQGQEGVTWERWTALADLAEASGLDSLFSSDHYRWLIGNRDGALDTWTVLAGLAARTSTLKLGTLVSPVTFRHPSLLARIVVTTDEIAGGGRIELGLGAGWHEPEHREHGFPFPPLSERLEQLAEQAEIITRAWAGGRFDFDGAHYRLEGSEPRPVPAQRPRLILGGIARSGTIAPAVAFADEYNTHFSSVAECRARYGRVAAACEAAGREPLPFSLMMNCVTASTAAELERRQERWLEVVGRPVDPERTIVGTTEQVVERLLEYAAIGVDRILLQDLSLNLDLIAEYGELARRLHGR